jgi:starch synthase
VEHGIDASKLVLNPFGVDAQHFAPPPRPAEGPFRVLFAGQLSQRKGLSYLIEGFRQAAIPDSELVLVGHVVNRSRPWEGERGVRYAGPVAPARMREHYMRAHVFALPSLVEGLARVLLEAMACGLPTVTTHNAGGTDVITDGQDGFIVPIRDSSAIAERLRALHDDDALRARVGASARARAERFSWDSYGRRLAAAIDEPAV